MLNLIDLTQEHRFKFQMEDLFSIGTLAGLNCKCLYDNEVIGSLKLFITPPGLTDEELLHHLDDIELIAVELYDASRESKKLQHQLSQSPFAYLTQFEVHPAYQNQGIGHLMLDYVYTLLQTFHIPNLYLVSVADTKSQQQKLHHFYSHHYFTYVLIPHPDKPAVMHREIELRY